MLRLKAIAPLDLEAAEVRRRQERYARLGGAAVAVSFVNLSGGPRRLDSAADVAWSAELVGREIDRTEAGQFDAVLPDCVLDPCVGETAHPPVPLYGILRLAASALEGLGARFTAVTRNDAIGAELRRKLALYGREAPLLGVHVLDVDFCLVADDTGWAAAMAPVVEASGRAGATHVLNGCSAVEVGTPTGGPPVVDPTRLALRVLAAADASGVLGGSGRRAPAPAD